MVLKPFPQLLSIPNKPHSLTYSCHTNWLLQLIYNFPAHQISITGTGEPKWNIWSDTYLYCKNSSRGRTACAPGSLRNRSNVFSSIATGLCEIWGPQGYETMQFTDISEAQAKQGLSLLSRPGLFSQPEDGSSMCPWNVSVLSDYKVSHLRRYALHCRTVNREKQLYKSTTQLQFLLTVFAVTVTSTGRSINKETRQEAQSGHSISHIPLL
jgi:hypothetical protein